MTGFEMKARGTLGVALVEINHDIGQGQLLTEPMHVAGDARHVKSPPVERTAINVEMQIAILSMHWDGAMDAGNRGQPELIRFNRAGNFRADGPRNDHRLGGAEAVRQEDELRREVHAYPVRAHLVCAALDAGGVKLQETVRVLQAGLQAAAGLAAKGEIGERRPPLEADPLQLLPVPPNLDADDRRVREGQ